jgi:hypothetical protein
MEKMIMKRTFLRIALGSFAATSLLLPMAVLADGDKPKVLKSCIQCHKGDAADTIRGKLGSVSMKAETLNVSTGSATWLLAFDEDTTLKGAEVMNKIDKDHEVSVNFIEEDGALYATAVKVKPPTELAEDELIRVDELASIVAEGPETANFTIIDARPGKLFLESHIPGALSIYDAQFDKHLDKLPKNKENLLVFYCGGPT